MVEPIQVNIDLFDIIKHLKDILSEHLTMLYDIFDHRLAEARARRKTLTNPGEQRERALSTLAPREEMILRIHFGIGRRAASLEDISRQFSLTPERVRHIEVEALRKLRQRTRSFYSTVPFAAFIPGER
jgi:DNA-directed RNA polymerase sigma subunit (sigma70/sigma32)